MNKMRVTQSVHLVVDLSYFSLQGFMMVLTGNGANGAGNAANSGNAANGANGGANNGAGEPGYVIPFFRLH